MKNILFLTALFLTSNLKAQSIIPLYKVVPNSRPTTEKELSDHGTDGVTRVSKVIEPSLTAFFPQGENRTRAAVIICPGGGYTILAINKEGTAIAKEFNKFGITAFVLKYRLPDSALQINKEIAPLQDAQQAVRLVRMRAGEWNIDPNKIGVMGFSAGGHLASTIGTHYKESIIENSQQVSLRPDFLVLCYPVISFNDSLGHRGSRNRLLGTNPSAEKIRKFSNEVQVDANTPPTFLVHAGDDKTVKVANSLRFYEALQSNGVKSEMHIYPGGGHGFGLVNKTTPDNWFERCINWMRSNNYLSEARE